VGEWCERQPPAMLRWNREIPLNHDGWHARARSAISSLAMA
jgi:hypothetical protein